MQKAFSSLDILTGNGVVGLIEEALVVTAKLLQQATGDQLPIGGRPSNGSVMTRLVTPALSSAVSGQPRITVKINMSAEQQLTQTSGAGMDQQEQPFFVKIMSGETLFIHHLPDPQQLRKMVPPADSAE